MMARVVHHSPADRRSRWRWLQFSLRTLLVLVTLASVACWWLLLPRVEFESIANGRLRLRREVISLADVNPQERDDYAGSWQSSPMNHGPAELVNHGKWQIQMEHDELLVDGRFEKNQSHGLWTTYYPSGRIAVQGTMHHGAKTGIWRVWNEDGGLLSEATYATRSTPRWVGGGGQPTRQAGEQFHSHLEGWARTWHLSGQIKMAGGYQNDQRDGPWMFYDERGHVTAYGDYRSGKRHGSWTIRDEQGSVREVVYESGRMTGEAKIER